MLTQKLNSNQQSIAQCFLTETLMLIGYWLRITAVDQGQLLAAQKLIFLGGCFLYYTLFLFTIDLCSLKIPKALRFTMTIIQIGLGIIMFTFDRNGLVYKAIDFRVLNGVPSLVETPNVFIYIYRGQFFGYAILMLLTVLSVIAHHKLTKRRTFLTLLLVGALLLPAIAFLLEKIIKIQYFNIMPFACAISITIIMSLIYLSNFYDFSDDVREIAYEKSDSAIITVSFDNMYRNCNPLALKMFPGLKKLSYNEELKGDEFKDIRDILENKIKEYYSNGRVYEVEIKEINKGGRVVGKVIWLQDATSHVEMVKFMKDYQSELSTLVNQKTAHIIEIQNKVLLSMSDIIEGRDGSTGGHVKRTSYVVSLLAEEMAKTDMLPAHQLVFKHIPTTAPLHDLGKLMVDDAILRKPGKLNDEEYEIMKTHAAKGAQMVVSILDGIENKDVLNISRNIACYHHERWDGKGYPEKLAGKDIPLEARIMAVADVYDALVSKRCYKEPMSFEQANSIMQEGFGSQFDPALKVVYDKCLPYIEKFYKENNR